MKVREQGYEEWEDASEYSESNWEDFIAQDFAEYYYHQAPCDPDKFEMTVEVLNDKEEIKVFTVSAEVGIDFYAEEKEDWQKIKCWLKQLFCKHKWKCMNYDCKYRKADWCGDEGLLHGIPLCWACYSRSVICKHCGKVKK